MAPIFTSTANHGMPIALTATAMGAGVSSSAKGTMPTSTAEVRM